MKKKGTVHFDRRERTSSWKFFAAERISVSNRNNFEILKFSYFQNEWENFKFLERSFVFFIIIYKKRERGNWNLCKLPKFFWIEQKVVLIVLKEGTVWNKNLLFAHNECLLITTSYECKSSSRNFEIESLIYVLEGFHFFFNLKRRNCSFWAQSKIWETDIIELFARISSISSKFSNIFSSWLLASPCWYIPL